MSLETKTLGRTGLKVTQLGYGALEVRGVSSEDPKARMPSEARAKDILNAVLDSGISFIDTAWCYGRSEEMIGKFISHRRSEFTLAAKSGHGNCSSTQYGSYTRKDILACIEESLRNLKTDYVDILQLHNPTSKDVEDCECIETLKDIQARGWTRFIGCSSVIPHLNDHLNTGAYDAFQLPYSALEPEHYDIISKSAKSGIGTIIRGGVAKGEPESAAINAQRVQNWKPSLGGSAGIKRWDMFTEARLGALVDEGETRTSFLLRFTLSHPDVHTIIVGTQNPEHLAQNVAAAEKGPLPPDVYREAKNRLRAVGLEHGQ
jgi:aryl-alcohol dehydrogenase-like predicted oxidoreductase